VVEGAQRAVIEGLVMCSLNATSLPWASSPAATSSRRGRAVDVVRHVVFARPDELHRRTDRLRRLDRRGNEIDFQSTPESAPDQSGDHIDLARAQAGCGRGGRLGDLLHLRAHVHIAAIGLHVSGAIHGLHGRVCQ